MDVYKDAIIYIRTKNLHTTVAEWSNELLNPLPWFKDLVPDVLSLPFHAQPSNQE
jgi:hypothetical protein